MRPVSRVHTVPRSAAAAVVALAGVLGAVLVAPPAVAGTAPPAMVGGTELRSDNGAYRLAMQTDGNLVVYDAAGTPRWDADTHGHPGARLAVQPDGNVVVYAATGAALWSTRTVTGSQNAFELHDDGALTVTGPDGHHRWRSSPLVVTTGRSVWSPGRTHRLAMQTDGNLVVYSSGGAVRWHASTYRTGADRIVMQTDGNLVMYAGTRPVWHTGTRGPGNRLAVQDDGNVVVYGRDGRALWAASRSLGIPYVPAFSWSARGVTQHELGATWRPGCPLAPSQLVQLTVLTYGFDGRVRPGRIIVNHSVAVMVRRGLNRMYDARFPIWQMRPVAEFMGDDDVSGEQNNSSGFNCRAVTGGTSWSMHSYGLAVDLNPVQNPYVKGSFVLPATGASYVDRSRRRPGMIHGGDVVTSSFWAGGWPWGGSWAASKDYMHFSSNGR